MNHSILSNMKIWSRLLEFFGLHFPHVLMLSMLGIKGYQLYLPDKYDFRVPTKPIKDENLIIQDIILDAESVVSEDKVALKLKSIFDPIWNACGFSQSINYDSVGKWIKNK